MRRSIVRLALAVLALAAVSIPGSLRAGDGNCSYPIQHPDHGSCMLVGGTGHCSTCRYDCVAGDGIVIPQCPD